MLEHVFNKVLLDRLLHCVAVERTMLHFATFLVSLAEHLQSLVFRRRGKGEVAGVLRELFLFDPLVEGVVDLVFAVGHRLTHRRGSLAALAGVRLVDDDGKLPAAMFVADAVEHMGKGLHRGDDQLLPVLEIFRELLRLGNSRAFLDRADDAAHLGEALDRLADLFVQNPAVGDDDDGIKDRLPVLRQADQLMSQPCDGVRLPAARAVLDEVALARAVLLHISQDLSHHIELMVARKNLHLLLLARFRVLLLHDLRVVLQNLRQARRCENALPQVVRF